MLAVFPNGPDPEEKNKQKEKKGNKSDFIKFGYDKLDKKLKKISKRSHTLLKDSKCTCKIKFSVTNILQAMVNQNLYFNYMNDSFDTAFKVQSISS